jgi:AcrR family transcriptional regulator
MDVDAAERSIAVAAPARRGRPCQLGVSERRQRLIEAAESEFLELGYGAAATSNIASRAGMSKKTLYRLFDSKESLFAAVIASRRESMELMPIGTAPCGDIGAVRRLLCGYVGQLARFILAARQAALYRLVIAEAYRTPELSRAFYREGPEKARAPLADWLRVQHEAGVLDVPDATLAASMMISMVVAEPHMRLMIGGAPAMPEDVETRVEAAVALFLAGAACLKNLAQNKMAGQERG